MLPGHNLNYLSQKNLVVTYIHLKLQKKKSIVLRPISLMIAS